VITRGIWFYDGTWQPVDPECSNSLERVYLEQFYGKKLSDYITDPCNKTPKAGNNMSIFSHTNISSATKKFGLKVNTEKTKYRFICHCQNAEQT
jgi:hypothetical protein